MPNGDLAWAMNLTKYVNDTARNCMVYIAEYLGGQYKLSKRAENPFAIEFILKLDMSPKYVEMDSKIGVS